MKRALALLTALMLLALSGCGSVRLNFTGTSPFRNIRDGETLSLISSAVDDFARETGAKVSVGVMRGKQTRFESRGEGMDEHTRVPIGPMTMMFGGLLVSNFEYNRWLGADETVSDWIKTPAPLPKGMEGIKVWQLACNVAGFGDVDTFGKDYFTAGMLYNQLDKLSTTAPAGAEYRESEAGYAMLSECIRQSYNMNANFVNLVNNQVIGKMDLQNSRFERRDALCVYDGYESTAYDLMKVVAYCGGMLVNDDVLSNTVEGALERRWSDGEHTVSLAFDMDEREGYTIYRRHGETDGHSAYIMFIPELGVGVSLVAEGECDLEPLARQLLSAAGYAIGYTYTES